MYKAVQSYTAVASHTLSINPGDTLCILEKTNDAWWLASNARGEVGYIPCSFIKLNEAIDSQDIVLQSIDRAISAVYATSTTGSLSTQQKSILRKLDQHKQEILSSNASKVKDANKRRAAPPPPAPSRSVDEDKALPVPHRSMSHKRQAPTVEQALTGDILEGDQKSVTSTASHNVQTVLSKHESNDSLFVEESSDKNQPKVPVQIGQELLNNLQEQCHISDAKSKDILESLLMVIGENIPPLRSVMKEITETLPEIKISEDPGITKLKLALENVMEIKNDAQQRNWAIEDDQEKISGILTDILDSLSTCNKFECIPILQRDHCGYIVMLTVYYQMESRVAIRLLVLQIIGVICSLSSKFVSAVITTVLPHELVLDITDHTDDIQRVCFSSLVLSMVFSTGEPIPLSYYDVIGEKFFLFLLDSVEDGLKEDTEDRCGDIFVRLILAINLHFLVPDANLIMKVIVERSTCTILSEKIMLLINRGDDPVKISEDEEESHPPHSVLKFLQDIFSRDDTALSFLYTNDLLVLTDIMSRNIADLPPGSKLRTDYLDLLMNVLARSTYHETKHRSSEILASLRRINDEELPEEMHLKSVVEFDKQIVNTILRDHMSSLT